MSLFDLHGRVAVVTGSSRGIGRAIVERMAEHGAKVVVSSRNLEPCREIAEAINAKYGDGRAIALSANISSKEHLRRLVDETMRAFGQIDILVCNAASNPHYGPMATISDEQLRKILDNNIVSNHWLITMVAPQMTARKDGSIIIVSSIGGLRGSPVIGTYCISKAADLQLARNLAVELGPHNVRINCIAPGLIRTDFARALWENPDNLKRRNAQNAAAPHRRARRDRRRRDPLGLAGGKLHHRASHRRRWRRYDCLSATSAAAPSREGELADVRSRKIPSVKRAPGSRPIARPTCGCRSKTTKTAAGAAATATFKSEGQRAVARAHGGARLDRAGMAEGIWRRRPVARGGARSCAAKCARSAAARRSIRSASGCSARRLLKYGTEAQKREHLPQIARGEIRWCQGYSEPNAGSDLASLATRAEDKGDHFLVNGQKIWTSYADKADWIFCLVRTDPAAPKHLGISFILFDMTTPGVSTKPILLISGKSPFCETFFDDVRVPKENVVGEINKGWDVAKYLLTHEREMISGIGLAGRAAARPDRRRFARHRRRRRSRIPACAPISRGSRSMPGVPAGAGARRRPRQGQAGASGLFRPCSNITAPN